MLQGEHSAILSTFINLPFVSKIIVLFIFEWPPKTGFTVPMFKWLQALLDAGAYFLGHPSQWPFQYLRPTGPRSAVGNVSGYRCVSDCRSRGREFDPGPVPYFRGD